METANINEFICRNIIENYNAKMLANVSRGGILNNIIFHV